MPWAYSPLVLTLNLWCPYIRPLWVSQNSSSIFNVLSVYFTFYRQTQPLFQNLRTTLPTRHSRGRRIPLPFPLVLVPPRFVQIARVSLLPSINGTPCPASLPMTPISSAGMILFLGTLQPTIHCHLSNITLMVPAGFWTTPAK